MDLSSAARHMTESKHTPSYGNKQYIETPFELRRLTEDIMDKDFSGFGEEKGSMRRLVNVEKELRNMKEVMSSLIDKHDKLTMENIELKLRLVECEKVSAINQGLKEEI
ncbi:hypothetical protein E2C01_029382 [Portunus trituberculatus]|uniref:Uncharacterized protein n=1 Tax=Portunus trituberculatus TaxID=210409 RepID=A0A5B7EUG2_PORTR|nr:hypothetical protein [Portunus trituberculatus]